MSIWVLRGLRDGVVTTRWPARPDPYADAWRGPARPLEPRPLEPGQASSADHTDLRPLPHRRDHGHRRHRAGRPGPLHPVRPLRGRAPRRLRLVAGRHRPGRAHPGAADHPRTARDRRGHPGRPGPAGRTDPGAAPQRARPARGRRLRRQRGVEIQALLGPVYDIHRLGILTASPRHADVCWSPAPSGMSGPLRTSLTPCGPKVVITGRRERVSSGLLASGEAITGGGGATVAGRHSGSASPAQPVAPFDALLMSHRLLTPDEAMAGELRQGLILLALAAAATSSAAGGPEAGPFYLLGAASSAALAVAGGFALTGGLAGHRQAGSETPSRAGRRAGPPSLCASPWRGRRCPLGGLGQ